MERTSSHPSAKIIGKYSDYLAGRCIALGLTGSVSVYKSIDVARWLMRRGARIIPIMTEPALEFVSPALLKWATSQNPIVKLTGDVEHIVLAEECDAALVAPATLSTMSKIAFGIADNPVALTAIAMRGEGKPVILVPAMHKNMLDSPAAKKTIEVLRNDDYIIIPPKIEEGIAKYPDTWIVARVTAATTSRGQDLKGKRVLVTAGATREWLDPTRFISNPSSGRMGIEVAVEAWARGAEVDLIYGAVTFQIPHLPRLYEAVTTEEMADIVEKLASQKRYDIAVAAAAPADYRPVEKSVSKIRSGIERLTLSLEPTPKVLDAIKGRVGKIVAFAAETVEDVNLLEKAAREKMDKYNAHIVVANRVGFRDVGFSSQYLEALILWRENGVVKKTYLGKVDKEILSRLILDLSVEG